VSDLKVGQRVVVKGVPAKVVGWRSGLKSPAQSLPSRYVVFVEQTGDFRLGSIRASAFNEKGEAK
jgi:hypothetical protein